MRNEYSEMLKMIEEEINKITEENRKTFNNKRKEAQLYDTGDLVAIAKTQFETGGKLKKKFLGPYKITEVKGNDRYNVEKIGTQEGPNKTSTAAENMKPWGRINMMKKVTKIETSVEPKQFTIILEGNIGAGKSSLLKLFERNKNIKILTFREPLEKWTNINGINLLDLMYKDASTWAFPFQNYAILTMMQNHVKKTDEQIKIMERSVFSAMYCFVEAHA